MPDQYGNPTEAEMRGQAPVDFYAPAPDMSLFAPAAVKAAVAARNSSGISTRDVYANGTVTHDERATPQRDNSAGATNFQSAFADDPYYQRADIAPFIAATNEDVLGKGKFGVRGWMNDHPLGVLGAFAALAAGGAALAGGLGAGAGGGAAASTTASTAAAPGSLASQFAGLNMGTLGSGAAGELAASGAITGGAGSGFLGSLGGTGLLSSASIARVGQLSSLLSGAKDIAGLLNPPEPAQSGGGGGATTAPTSFAPYQNTAQGGAPMSFDPSGFRDQNAFSYLLNTLGLPSPQSTAAAPEYALPDNLKTFSGADFGSAFSNFMGTKPMPAPGSVMSSPKTSPFASLATAQNSGTRGPDANPSNVLAALAGPLGNGGGSFTTKLSARIKSSTKPKPRMVK